MVLFLLFLLTNGQDFYTPLRVSPANVGNQMEVIVSNISGCVSYTVIQFVTRFVIFSECFILGAQSLTMSGQSTAKSARHAGDGPTRV